MVPEYKALRHIVLIFKFQYAQIPNKYMLLLKNYLIQVHFGCCLSQTQDSLSCSICCLHC